VRDNEENLAFLEAHPECLHEHALGHLLLEALQLGMEGKSAAMRRVVKQKYHIKSLLDFAEAHKTSPRAVLRPFFGRLAEARVAAEYDKAFEGLLTALVARAAEKKVEAAKEAAARAAAEAELEPLTREERLGPGGLDPVEVFESLPAPLQAAFEAKDATALRSFIDGCEEGVARDIMRRMVGSGLWVPEPGQEGTLLRDEE
jgi:cell division cycle protein 37